MKSFFAEEALEDGEEGDAASGIEVDQQNPSSEEEQEEEESDEESDDQHYDDELRSTDSGELTEGFIRPDSDDPSVYSSESGGSDM